MSSEYVCARPSCTAEVYEPCSYCSHWCEQRDETRSGSKVSCGPPYPCRDEMTRTSGPDKGLRIKCGDSYAREGQSLIVMLCQDCARKCPNETCYMYGTNHEGEYCEVEE